MIAKLRKAIRVARRGGLGGVLAAAREQAEAAEFEREYARWVREFDTLDDAGRSELADRAAATRGPLISILMPVYNTDERFLREALESVCGQIYPAWELCIADDASTARHVRRVINEFAERDERIRPVFREVNGHISAASNSALEIARGDFAMLMDHDDLLPKHALFYIAEALDNHPDASLIYSDEDKIDSQGRRFGPYFKPAWSPELFYSQNFIGHLAAYRTSTLREVGGFREGFEGSQDYDLTLRFIEKVAAADIVHVPRILYHWRAVPGSVAFDSGEKGYAHERARKALREHFARRGEKVNVIRGAKETHRARPTGSLEERVNIVRVGGSGSGGFDVALKRGRETDSDVLIFLSQQCEGLSPDSQLELAYLALREGAGVVGCMITDSRGRIVNAGGTSIDGNVVKPYAGAKADSYGYAMSLGVVRNVLIATEECFALSKKVLDEHAGDAQSFAGLCIDLHRKGLRNIWTPWARVVVDHTRERNPDNSDRGVSHDPYLNPNLTLRDGKLMPAFPPRREV